MNNTPTTITPTTVTSRQLLDMYEGRTTVPAGFRLESSWGCDPACGDDVTAITIEHHESGRDISHYAWLEEIAPAVPRKIVAIVMERQDAINMLEMALTRNFDCSIRWKQAFDEAIQTKDINTQGYILKRLTEGSALRETLLRELSIVQSTYTD